MADIKLGISGSEVTLPVMGFTGGVPNASVRPVKGMEKSVMSDGTPRYSVFRTTREWPLSWGMLTYAEVQVLQGLADLNVALRFQDNRESATWFNVTVTSFTYDALAGISSATQRWYQAQMVIAEL